MNLSASKLIRMLPVSGLLLLFLSPLHSLSQQLVPCQVAGDVLIQHEAITIDYNIDHKQARWSYYILTHQRRYGVVKRKSNFSKDPALRESESCSNADYLGGRCDRGHLAPAEDMSFSRTAMSESFFLSNISPQVPAFNRGIWKRVETQVRSWKSLTDTLHVITGGCIREGLPKLKGRVSIPDKFYKIIVAKDPSGVLKAIAFLIPNKPSKEPLSKFLVTIDELELLTTVDFCFKLNDRVEETLESSSADMAFWRLTGEPK